MRPVFCRHRTMKSDNAGSIAKIRKQRRDIAVADENFGMRLDYFQVELIEQVVCSIAPSCADDGSNVIAREHFFQFACPAIDGAGEIKVLFQNRLEVEGIVSGEAQGFASGVQV